MRVSPTTRFRTELLSLSVLLAVVGASSLTACGDDSRSYSVEIIRTANGVPHIIADDFGSAGYGYGYAYAQDNFCVLMREIVSAQGQSARYLAGEGGDNVKADFVWRFFNEDERAQREFLDPLPGYAADTIQGFAEGMNRHLTEVGVDGLAEGDEGCRGEPWVRPITSLDLAKVYRKLALRAGIDALGSLIIDAEAPVVSMASAAPYLEPIDLSIHDLGVPEPSAMGSNAYGFGSATTDSGRGVLLGNPHFPWAGSQRFYMAHMTVRGRYDVAGASLQGVPVINIGFNGNIAWSHTVSTARRFTLYELTLDPEDPTRYLYDGESLPIETNEVTIEVELPDGTIEERSDAVYMTRFGPIVDLSSQNALVGGWPTIARTVFALRDANYENTGLVQQWLEMGMASNMDEFEDAMRGLGIPWVNTVAVDRDGQAYYGDVGAVPGVSEALIDECSTLSLSNLLTELGLITLDGSRSDCEWQTGLGAREGILGYDELPHLRTTDYVANANDTYWLANPRSPLEGYSPILGPERYEQSTRTRQAFVQAEARIAGTDGRGDGGVNLANLQEMMFDSTSHAATLARASIVTACEDVVDWTPFGANAADYASACTLLGTWDGRFRGASVGAHIFRETWQRVDLPSGAWSVPFDADDPVNTPRALDLTNTEVTDALREGLAAGVDRLNAAGLALDAPFSDLQFREVGGERIPIHGMPNGLGFSVITSSLVNGAGYTNIRHGNSYMQTITWDDSDCPEAFALLSYSQSTDPASDHYADQTQIYSDAQWPAFPFCEAEVTAAEVSRETLTFP